MLIQFQNYLSFENLYLWANFGVLPFWLMLIFIPNSKITQIFVNSVILPLILATAYVYTIYQTILLDEPIFDIFKLYLSLDDLYTIFAIESFLLVFWLHFLALNLFLLFDIHTINFNLFYGSNWTCFTLVDKSFLCQTIKIS